MTDQHIMKSTYALVAASLLALVAACDQGVAQTTRAPTQAEEIEEFCNQVASDFVASGGQSTALFMGRIQQKMLEEEWDSGTVSNTCSEALRRKTEFIQQHAQAIERRAQ